MNEWQIAFEEIEQSVQHDANDFGYTDNMEDAARAKYAKDLLAYIKQIKPK